MKKLTPKIVFNGFIVIVVTSFIPNVILFIVGEGQRPINFVSPWMVFVGALTIISFSISIFSVLMNRLVVKRIKRLNQAVEKVMHGDFDITIESHSQDEISHLIHNFNSMAETLKKNAYVNKAFARNFSHEMKTPLTVIMGYAELIQNEFVSEEDKVKYLQFIIEETKRLNRLSESMLLISQVEHATIIEKYDAFNMTEMIRNIVQRLQLLWEEKEQRIHLDLDEIFVTSNKELMYQVLYNLIHNAITHSDHQQDIHMLFKKEKNLKFVISNPGHLDENERTHIFDLFIKKDSARNTKSTGVGLTLTKSIIDKLGGSIQVSSQNQIITFTFSL